MEKPFHSLTAVLDKNRQVLVQTHDFPDHDAAGAAYGLCELLMRFQYDCAIVYGGCIQSISLANMIARLEIPLFHLDSFTPTENAQTVCVDGSPFSGTIKTLAGNLCGIIDHHPQRKRVDSPFIDLRTESGSCSAMIWTYWQDAGEIPDKTTATALLAGIQLDTNFLSRNVSAVDLDAHYHLFFMGNPNLARDIVNISLSIDQLSDIGNAFRTVLISQSILLAEVHGDYSAELLSVLADFLLRLKEITLVAVLAVKGTEYHISTRCRDPFIDVGHVLRKILVGIGSGGGHPHMAGGIIAPGKYPGAKDLLDKLAHEADNNRRKNESHSQEYRD